MLAFVINRLGTPLMPCQPGKARHLLKQGQAEVVCRQPFTIRLLYGSSGYKQPVSLGIDAGFTHIGISAITKKREVFAGEVKLRSEIVELTSERRQYRRGRRSRKTWYREPRFLNRGGKKAGWIAPSIQNKLDTHLRAIANVQKILPISHIMVEVASFDIQKIKNPAIEGVGYQEGEQSEFWNVREYVFHRDGHICQHCQGKSKELVLHVHHITSRQTGGDRPENLITLCETCHQKHHQGKIECKVKPLNGFKAETFMTTVRWMLVNRLKAMGLSVSHTYGHITKSARIALTLPKSHVNDAFVIAGGHGQERLPVLEMNQNRRNNRKLQLNRKGFKPRIRRQRYPYSPADLVKAGDRIYTVKGVFNYGKWIRVVDKQGAIKNMVISKIASFKYQKGLACGYRESDG